MLSHGIEVPKPEGNRPVGAEILEILALKQCKEGMLLRRVPTTPIRLIARSHRRHGYARKC